MDHISSIGVIVFILFDVFGGSVVWPKVRWVLAQNVRYSVGLDCREALGSVLVQRKP